MRDWRIWFVIVISSIVGLTWGWQDTKSVDQNTNDWSVLLPVTNIASPVYSDITATNALISMKVSDWSDVWLEATPYPDYHNITINAQKAPSNFVLNVTAGGITNVYKLKGMELVKEVD